MQRFFGFEQTLNRRALLSLAALSLTGLLTACGKSSEPDGPASQPTPTATPTRPPTLTEKDWTDLAQSLQGDLVRPNSDNYAVARQLFNTRFDAISPQGLAYCASPTDVQTCLAFVRRFALPVTARCGGHSYAGYSTTSGLVLDVTRMKQVKVDENAGTATIDGGARLIDVYSTLAQHGVVLPAGSCPTVGIAGLTLGGGVGVLSRKFGLSSDSLLSAQVVLASGETVTCDQNTRPDLFWALRGGGGGNFGVVTSFTFQVYPVSFLVLFTLNWPWSSAVDVVDAWQHWGPQAPDELWSNCLLLESPNKQVGPLVSVNGVYVGSADALNPFLQQLIDSVGSAPSGRYVFTDSLIDAMMAEAGCYGKSVEACHLPGQNPQGQVGRDTSKASSDYVNKALPRQAIEILVDSINKRQSSSNLSGGGIGMDAFGGAISRISADATAFVHRNALFSIQYTASWNANDNSSVVSANASWLKSTWQAMRPYVSGEAYQNYIDPDLADWKQAYYGANLARLQQVKKTYDPTNLFHFAQSIPPA